MASSIGTESSSIAQRPLPDPFSESDARVVIVGGGLAGLATAVALAEHGVRPVLLESRATLGGRASSFTDAATGEELDNCQHVTMGCCTNLAHFCRRTGIDDLLARCEDLAFQGEDGRIDRLRPAPLPVPFHLLPSFASMRFLSWSERCRIAWGLAFLASPLLFRPRPRESLAAWLRRHGQTKRTIDRFWAIILTSALNESLDRIEPRYARQVFVEGFLWSRESSRVDIPSVSLGELYGRRLRDHLTAMGVELRLTSPVDAIEPGPAEGAFTVRYREGRERTHVPASRLVLAVTPQRARDLLPKVPELTDLGERLARLEYAPITSVHLWYDRPVMDRPHLVPVGRTVQWLFRRPGAGASGGETDGGGGQPSDHYLQAVISASRDLVGLGKEAIVQRIAEEVRQILPRARGAKLLRGRAVTERSATFSVLPGIDDIRPDQATPLPGFFLAGDYTRSGWPATMEGAVRSGFLAAERVLESLGQSARCLVPPLSPSLFARLLRIGERSSTGTDSMGAKSSAPSAGQVQQQAAKRKK